MPPPDNHDQRPTDTRPYLCIPYWTTPLTPGGQWDTGDRVSLPVQVCSYACESIHASAYQPGADLHVTVDVRNSGGGNAAAIATVVVYWATPSAGFAHPTFFAATTVAVRPSRNAPATTSTPTMTAKIPAEAPPHICLLACVSHPQDRAGTVCDPIHDRHWAQRNLQAETAGVGAPVIVPLLAANPFDTARWFQLRIGRADEQRARRVAAELRTEPSEVRARLRLLDDQGAEVSEPGDETQVPVELGGYGERRFQLMIELDVDIPPGRSAAVEAILSDRQVDRGPVGSLGVALLPPGPE